MTIAVDPERARRRTDGIAANDDHLGLAAAGFQSEPRSAAPARNAERTAQPLDASGGWDAFDVWRRLIKEARERRAGRMFPPPAED